jgi:hypothetical protein
MPGSARADSYAEIHAIKQVRLLIELWHDFNPPRSPGSS